MINLNLITSRAFQKDVRKTHLYNLTYCLLNKFLQSWNREIKVGPTFFLNTYVLLDPNADIRKVETKMTKIFEEDAPELIKRMEQESHTKFDGSYMLQPFN